ncbi:MAG: phosphoadenosine phosphosulfate reductase family protein [Microthrixaceae bacterium]|nr:phosphoadenosine phosphosulfate reductase family protein [Microthrixaceae bacterium]
MSAEVSNLLDLQNRVPAPPRQQAPAPLEPAPGLFQPRTFSDAELHGLDREFETTSASGDHRVGCGELRSRPGACGVDDRRRAHRPGHKGGTAIEVVFIDTGYHFPETLETVELVRRRYGLNLKMMTVPHHDEALWEKDPENCCSAVKVGQLDRALAGKAAWMSGAAP